MVTTGNEPEAAFKVWTCILCGFVYDEAEGLPASGIAAGTRWADVPADFICPECSATKADFEMIEI
jgi:rubredoxin